MRASPLDLASAKRLKLVENDYIDFTDVEYRTGNLTNTYDIFDNEQGNYDRVHTFIEDMLYTTRLRKPGYAAYHLVHSIDCEYSITVPFPENESALESLKMLNSDIYIVVETDDSWCAYSFHRMFS